MGLKENQYYDRDLISYPVLCRQKKNLNTKKTTNIDLKIRKRNAQAHERNLGRKQDRMKKYSTYDREEDDVVGQSNSNNRHNQTNNGGDEENKKTSGKLSPTSIETSSIDLHIEKILDNQIMASKYTTMTPKKPSTTSTSSTTPTSSSSKYHTPNKNDHHGKFTTPSKMPRKTSGNGSDETTPTKSPFSETLPDGILSPVSITPIKGGGGGAACSSSPSLSTTTTSTTTPLPLHKKYNSFSPPPNLPQIQSLSISQNNLSSYTPDAVSRSIFHTLFGASTKSMSSSSIPWDEEDEDEEGEEEDTLLRDDLYHCKTVEPVDELWFTRLMSTSLLTTQALDYALHHTTGTSTTSFFQQQLGNSINTSEDLLSTYINSSFVTSLITQLPFEDERFTSPRLSVLKAIYKAVPKFRYFIANSLLSVSNQRFMRCKTSSKLAIMYELDVNHTGTKIGDMFSYSIPEHVDIDSAYTCFPIDNIHYPPKKTPSPLSTSTSAVPSLSPQISTQQQQQQQQKSLQTSSTPPAFIRDHDISLIEMNLFMIITSDYDMNQNYEPSSPSSSSPTTADEGTAKPSLFRVFLSIIITVLRCYGRRLGKTTEGVEQPNVLKSCLRALEEITHRVQGDEIEKIILPAILHSWPGGGNSVREAAFLKALGVVLPHCNPTHITNPLLKNKNSKDSSPSPSLSFTLPSSTPFYKILTRIILCLNSIHFKVCQESIQLLLNEKILSHYLFDTDECRHLLDLLVNTLRQNRSHWNTNVRQISGTCLDQIFELME